MPAQVRAAAGLSCPVSVPLHLQTQPLADPRVKEGQRPGGLAAAQRDCFSQPVTTKPLTAIARCMHVRVCECAHARQCVCSWAREGEQGGDREPPVEGGPARGGPWDLGYLRDPHSPLTLRASFSSTRVPGALPRIPWKEVTAPTSPASRNSLSRGGGRGGGGAAGPWGQSPVPQGRTGTGDSASESLYPMIWTGLVGRFSQGQISKQCRPQAPEAFTT